MEGNYTIDIEASTMYSYLTQLSKLLGMTITHGPVIQNEAEAINPIHKGFEGVIMWAESGTHAYSWELGKFFSIDVYSCSPYENFDVLNFTQNFFNTIKLAYEATCSRDGTNSLTEFIRPWIAFPKNKKESFNRFFFIFYFISFLILSISFIVFLNVSYFFASPE